LQTGVYTEGRFALGFTGSVRITYDLVDCRGDLGITDWQCLEQSSTRQEVAIEVGEVGKKISLDGVGVGEDGEGEE
jgi:hypothetical protein